LLAAQVSSPLLILALGKSAGVRQPYIRQASVAPSTTAAMPIDPRIIAIAAGIAAAIPEAQVRLFGSRARGTSRPDSDVDLLITVPDHWLTGQDRVRVLGELWRQYSSHRLPLDLLLYTESEVSQRQQYRSAVTSIAYQEGILLNG
jgi:predicted nucleotidyltransferase